MEAMRPMPAASNIVLRNATGIAYATMTAVMLLVAFGFWMQFQTTQQTRSRVIHTYEVRAHIRFLYSRLRNAESAQLGFLLTGDPVYLKPYYVALHETDEFAPDENLFLSDQPRSIQEEIALLHALTADNPRQQHVAGEIEKIVGSYLSYLNTSIETKQKSGKNPSIISQYHAKEMMNDIQSLVRLMEVEENHLLNLRTEKDTLQLKQNEIVVFGCLALFYIAKMAAFGFYQRHRARTEKEQIRYTEMLERSEEELRMQQEELKASNEEIEASSEELAEKNRALEEQNMQIQQQAEELEESKQLVEEKIKEVERASKYKSEFLANMSHELRTPLNSLLILAKLLAANEEANLTEEQVEEARVIYNGGLELLALINDILDLSKVEAGKLHVAPEDISLSNIISRMERQFKPVARERNVMFPVKVAANLPAHLFTDGQRVEQILKNLLSNAFKFTEKGSVTLEVRRPDTSELQRASLACSSSIAFCVIDTGIGIEESKFKDIFEAFQQEDGSIDRHYGGTGLGLTIARKFAHMLGGEIHVQSEKGKGSVFTLVLPVRMEASAPPPMETVVPLPTARVELRAMPRAELASFIADDREQISEKDRVLLIIEDDKNFANILVKIAHKRGYKCLAAGDARTGLLLAAEQRIDAVLLDLSLPDMDGMQVLEHLKQNLHTRHIPVHIISGREEDNVLPMRKGAIGYLVKPAGMEAIDGVFTRIETLLNADMKHVLVVEDDEKTQRAIQSLLRQKDVALTMVERGSVALEQVRANHFDCIVLDLQLPDMTGFEWLQRIEKAMSDRLPPVIVYTARSLTEQENRQLEQYTDSIIIKGTKSSERLLDEVTLFLHSVESSLPADQQQMIRMQHNPDQVLRDRIILLVDDDLRNTFALSKLLRKHGMQVIIADNGEMALEKLAAHADIELVIMDIMMPVMDGYQAMHAIRADKRWRMLPIIALTARAMPEEQEKCMAAGANDYLTKPMDIDRLLTLLRVWLFKKHEVA